jgi:predicted ATPase/DNA-binding SARP family transcriptional activator
MTRLTLNLLGPLQVTRGGLPVVFAYDKVPALLAYLAAEAERAHPRETLAELFWPDRPGTVSRHSLSQALTVLRRVLDGPEYLAITRDSVQFNLTGDSRLDLAEFNKLLQACDRHGHPKQEPCEECAERLEQAAALYRGDFLAQFSLADSAGFENWVSIQREGLGRRVLQALAQLANHYEAQNELERALAAVQRQLALAAWDEPAHRQAMQLLALNGQRGAALAQYQRCREILAAELGVEPEAATEALHARIKSGDLSSRSAGPAARPRHNLPAQPTPLIGREADLARLAERLADPTCRLISLVGPGGVGKTRLALQAAADQAPNVPQGIWFVALAPLSSPDFIANDIAAALTFTPYGTTPLKTQLIEFLHDQHVLLVLDNFEHLLAGAGLLADILAGAPQVRILVTSRARLDLRSEWVFEVGGLSFPTRDEVDGLEDYGAVQLFAESARRASSVFELRVNDRSHVVDICRLVRGMPLAIELAAAWLPVLSTEEIAAEIGHSLDFLAIELRDLPERHRSMRAVFDQSWRLLTEPERSAFRRLSVFRGGFTRPAAESVTGASLADLSRLAAKSLIQRAASGRYEVHELLRQYGAGHLAQRPDDARDVQARHARHYMAFLAARESELKGSGHQAALAEIEGELENIRAAWEWAAGAQDAGLIAGSTYAFWLFAEVRGRYTDAEIHFRMAVESLRQSPESLHGRSLALGKTLACLGSWYMRMGDPGRLRDLAGQSLGLLRPLGARREIAFALNMLAAAAHLQGAYAEEQNLLEESIALGQASGDRWISGYSLNDLGMAMFVLGQGEAARPRCEAALALFREIGDQRGIAFALNNIGAIAAHFGNYAEAEGLLRDGLALWRASGHRWGTATTLIQLGAVARAQGNEDQARLAYLEAIQVAMAVRTWPPALEAMLELAAQAADARDAAQAGRIALAVLAHPACTVLLRGRAERLRADLSLPANGPAPEINVLVAELLGPGVPAF